MSIAEEATPAAKLGRPARPAQGGSAAHRRARHLRRQHGHPGHALHVRRARLGGAREDHEHRRRGREVAAEHRRRLHGRGLRRVDPDVLGAARRRDQDAGPPDPRQGRGQARLAGGRRRRRDRQVPGRRRGRRGRRRLRGTARRHRPGGGAEGRLAARLARVRHQQDAPLEHRRRRRGQGDRGSRSRHRAADRQPPRVRRADRAALDDRRPARRPPDHPLGDPDPAHPALRAVGDPRHPGGQPARRRAARRRRLRREAPDLRRGGPLRGDRAQARPPGQVDGDALRAHGDVPPRPRPDQLRDDRG